MRLTLRLSLSLICGVAAVSLVLAFYQTHVETQGLRGDLDRQSRVLAESLAKSAEPLVIRQSYRDLQKLVDRLKDRERIAGVAVYSAGSVPERTLAVTEGLEARVDRTPAVVSQAIRDDYAEGAFIDAPGGRLHVAAVPLRDDTFVIGALAVFHDTAYIDAQAAALWQRALTGVAIQTLLIGSIVLLTIRWGVGRPMQRMAKWMRELRAGGNVDAPPEIPSQAEFAPLTREVTRLASSLTAARAAAIEEARLRESAESVWTQERLRIFVNGKLGDSRIFAVSNREPYEHRRGPSGIEAKMPASGLVTALEPVLAACHGTWIAQATGDADRETVDQFDRVEFRRIIRATRCAACG